MFNRWCETPVRVLYVGKSPILAAEAGELARVFGEVQIIMHNKRVPTPEWLANHVRTIKAEYVIPILPLGMIKRLAEIANDGGGFKVLYPVMERVKTVGEAPTPNVDYDPAREVPLRRGAVYDIMRFSHFIVLREVRLVGERLGKRAT